MRRRHAACIFAVFTLAAPTFVQAQALPAKPEWFSLAVAQLDTHAAQLMDETGIPGMAIAVVHDGAIVYAKGFGARVAGQPETIDPDTVFQIASMSKPIGATVIALQVAAGTVTWDTPLRDILPWITLSEPYVSDHVTIGDLYAHRSGLPDHAGDSLEELGYDRDIILKGLGQLPLAPFRNSYAYTNYGLSAAAYAVAEAAGTDWATLSETTLYAPLGMTSTSSRFADFQSRENRALGHVSEGGVYVVGPERDFVGEQRWSTAYNTDPQAPAGGVSSSVNDIARWMMFLLDNQNPETGLTLANAALWPAITPKTTIHEAPGPDQRGSHYGYGFMVDPSGANRAMLSHSGAFAWGASTAFSVIPSLDAGIVVLTNAWPTGVAESVMMQFNDIVQFGEPKQDWYGLYAPAFAAAFAPQGKLAGLTPPASPAPSSPVESLVGAYSNPHLGAAEVTADAGGELTLHLGAGLALAFPLTHWDGDTFTFVPLNDSAPPGSISAATFAGGALTLEHYDHLGFGSFEKASKP